mmetsp:Transcript_21655/g.60462  ORF Transcript_21655/g.60462 Transcript_21655/m.60462 type:complete len:214 (+) Transcript_21655:188-829(+)
MRSKPSKRDRNHEPTRFDSEMVLLTRRPPARSLCIANVWPDPRIQSGLCTSSPLPTNISSITRSKWRRSRCKTLNASSTRTSTSNSSRPKWERANSTTCESNSTPTIRALGVKARKRRAALPPASPKMSARIRRRRTAGKANAGTASASQTQRVDAHPGRQRDAKVPSTMSSLPCDVVCTCTRGVELAVGGLSADALHTQLRRLDHWRRSKAD